MQRDAALEMATILRRYGGVWGAMHHHGQYHVRWGNKTTTLAHSSPDFETATLLVVDAIEKCDRVEMVQ